MTAKGFRLSFSMILDFNLDKSISATAYLLERRGGSDGMFLLLKRLYYADRTALIKWGNSITGDKLASMENGPVVSGIYDLLKGNGTKANLTRWEDFIERKSSNIVTLRRKPNFGLLSEREREALNHADRTIAQIKGKAADWLHENCPEWKNPGKSSTPIDPSIILRKAKKSEKEIQQLEEDNAEIRLLKSLLGFN
jgi:hypothetical protein